MLKVLGKGQKWRVVPMPSSVMDALSKYLASRGLPEVPSECDPGTPLIAPLNHERRSALGHAMLYKLLKSFFEEAAFELERRGHREDAERIAKASTHWLRHTRGSHSAERMPLNLLQRLLGHASLTTTSIYTSVDEEALYEAMEQELRN
jgi:site-specific recombinase XerD